MKPEPVRESTASNLCLLFVLKLFVAVGTPRHDFSWESATADKLNNRVQRVTARGLSACRVSLNEQDEARFAFRKFGTALLAVERREAQFA